MVATVTTDQLAVVRYVLADPELFALILTMARLEATAKGLQNTGLCAGCREMRLIYRYDSAGENICRTCSK